MNKVTIFKYEEGKLVRTLNLNGEPWFVLRDVCEVLGLGNSRMVADRLDEDEKGVSQIDTLGGVQNATIISESGLYNVILRSDKPEPRRSSPRRAGKPSACCARNRPFYRSSPHCKPTSRRL